MHYIVRAIVWVIVRVVAPFLIILLSACGDTSAPAASGTNAAAESIEAAKAAKAAIEGAAAGVTQAVDQAQAEGDSGSFEVDLAAGEAIYNRSCLSCHAAGIAGAPKTGSAEDWAPRVAKGIDALVQSSIKGVPPAMPAKGLCFDCNEDDMRNVVEFMLSKSSAN